MLAVFVRSGWFQGSSSSGGGTLRGGKGANGGLLGATTASPLLGHHTIPAPKKRRRGYMETFFRKYKERSKRIDVVSRLVFPTGFILFNIVYWAVYLIEWLCAVTCANTRSLLTLIPFCRLMQTYFIWTIRVLALFALII